MNIRTTREDKNHKFYINTTTTIYMTHNLYFLINAKLDLVYEEFKIAYSHKTPI